MIVPFYQSIFHWKFLIILDSKSENFKVEKYPEIYIFYPISIKKNVLRPDKMKKEREKRNIISHYRNPRSILTLKK